MLRKQLRSNTSDQTSSNLAIADSLEGTQQTTSDFNLLRSQKDTVSIVVHHTSGTLVIMTLRLVGTALSRMWIWAYQGTAAQFGADTPPWRAQRWTGLDAQTYESWSSDQWTWFNTSICGFSNGKKRNCGGQGRDYRTQVRVPPLYSIRLASCQYLYRHIVQELQRENSLAAQRNKVLESENKLLLSETERLREVMAISLLPDFLSSSWSCLSNRIWKCLRMLWRKAFDVMRHPWTTSVIHLLYRPILLLCEENWRIPRQDMTCVHVELTVRILLVLLELTSLDGTWTNAQETSGDWDEERAYDSWGLWLCYVPYSRSKRHTFIVMS